MLAGLSQSSKKWLIGEWAHYPNGAPCEVKQQLLDEFLGSIRELTAIQKEQSQAVIEGDADFSRFDLLLHVAQEKKDSAKYAWIAHVESHGCGEL
jgi:hypothetical protein